jgi:hypothetical protein
MIVVLQYVLKTYIPNEVFVVFLVPRSDYKESYFEVHRKQ